MRNAGLGLHQTKKDSVGKSVDGVVGLERQLTGVVIAELHHMQLTIVLALVLRRWRRVRRKRLQRAQNAWMQGSEWARKHYRTDNAVGGNLPSRNVESSVAVRAVHRHRQAT